MARNKGGGEKNHTLQLEQHALASRDLCTSLAHALERPGYFLLIATRHAVCEYVYIVLFFEQIQSRLEHADVGLYTGQPPGERSAQRGNRYKERICKLPQCP
jgi:hypothetical protein